MFHVTHDLEQTLEMKHVITGNCLERGGKEVVMEKCTNSQAQKWEFSRHYTLKNRTKG